MKRILFSLFQGILAGLLMYYVLKAPLWASVAFAWLVADHAVMYLYLRMNNNIKNFMKPKTEPYYKQVKTSKLHCPYCHQIIRGDGGYIPYECECGKWNCSVEEKGFVWELTKKCD